ncbi:HAD family hydrolase [Streptomyces sp. CNQ-509]|uniref:HAD family hydrolase n=1 Tax=Streptomyces sp. CNQ-509 TaxID=444103 RepID=UPI0034638F36
MTQEVLVLVAAVVVAGDEVDRPEPAPDGLSLAERRLGVQAEAIAYVGDAEVDLGSGDERSRPPPRPPVTCGFVHASHLGVPGDS